MTLRIHSAPLATLALLAALSLVPATAAAARGPKSAVREFTGTVAAVKAGGRSFRLRRPGHAGVQVRVVRATKVAKGARPRKGRRLVIKARRDGHGWVARSVKLVRVASGEDQAGSDDDEVGDDEEIGDDQAGDGDEQYGDAGDESDLEDAVGDLLGDPGNDEE